LQHHALKSITYARHANGLLLPEGENRIPSGVNSWQQSLPVAIASHERANAAWCLLAWQRVNSFILIFKNVG